MNKMADAVIHRRWRLRTLVAGVGVACVLWSAVVATAVAGCTTLIPQGGWLYGWGVEVYGTGTCNHECADLAYRQYQAMGWGDVGGLCAVSCGAKDMWTLLPKRGGFTLTAQGSITAPVVGDLIIHDGTVGGGFGHVAVINEIKPTDPITGITPVIAVEQGSPDKNLGIATYQLKAGSLARTDLGGILGIVHSNANIGPDNDRDLVPNTRDACPNVAGAQADGCPVANASNNLVPGEVLGTNQAIYSNNGLFFLVMQGDGNLVIYRNWPTGGASWSSVRAGSGANNWLVMQADGNLVEYTSAGAPVWATNTGQRGSYLVLQDDGNLVMYSSTGVRWASNTAMALPFPPFYQYKEIRNLNSGLCVDARGGGTGNGTIIQQYTCNATLSQRFMLWPVGGGYFYLMRAGTSSQVIDVSAASRVNGARIQTWVASNVANQKFFVQQLGANNWRFVAQHSGMCIDVPGASKTSGQALQQYSCNGTLAQSFSIN